jgi:parallel beta-helix repeat protein
VIGHEYTGENWSSSGILLYDSSSSHLEGNLVHSNNVGVYAYNGDGMYWQNEVFNNGWGIFLYDSAAEIYGNTIVENGVGLDLYGDESTTAQVAFSRIAGNGTGIENELETAIDANNNWWGCNEGPEGEDCDSAVGLVNVNNWLVLTLTTDTEHILAGQPGTFTASIRSNSEDVVIPDTEPFPDGAEVLFETSAGMIDPETGILDLGDAVAELSVSAEQGYVQASVSATLDNETVTIELPVGMDKTWLPVLLVPVR